MKLSNFWVDTLSSDRWPHSRCICYNLHFQMYSMYVHRFSAFWLRSKLLEANFDSSFKDNVLSYGQLGRNKWYLCCRTDATRVRLRSGGQHAVKSCRFRIRSDDCAVQGGRPLPLGAVFSPRRSSCIIFLSMGRFMPLIL